MNIIILDIRYPAVAPDCWWMCKLVTLSHGCLVYLSVHWQINLTIISELA
jgi:hypothetical protein